MNPVVINRVVEALLLPPGSIVVLLLAALLFWRFRGLSRTLVVIAAALLYVASIPVTANWLVDSLEQRFTPISPASTQIRGAGAIVVLGAGRYPDAPEYGGDTVSITALQRLRYSAALHRRTGLPILVSGGSTMEQAIPEAQLMRQSLAADFNVHDVWSEDESRTTAENARRSAESLAKRGVYRVFLVTNALHMQRAVNVFRNAGLEVIPAPTGFHQPHPLDRGVAAWLPRIDALQRTSHALHEYLGMAWYQLRGW